MRNKKILDEIKDFAENIKYGYNKTNYAQLLCNIRFFDQKLDGHKEFIQVPIRIIMDYNDFDGGVDNSPLGFDLGGEIANGEFNYLIEKLGKSLKSDNLKSFDKESIPKILKDAVVNFEPSYFLIPIDDFYQNVHHLVDIGMAKYENSDLIIHFKGFKIKIIWSSLRRPFDDIYLIGKDSISWIRKKINEMKKIPNTENYTKELNSKDDIVNILFGKTPEHKLDFICKTVSLAEINDKKIKKYTISK